MFWPTKQVRTMLRATLSHYHNNIYLLTGLLRFRNGRYYNSFVTLDRDLNIRATYDKSHLVPFGEYIPCKTSSQ